MDLKINKWEESYKRGENFIFYPHEEVVKFINRFIRKKLSENNFCDVIYNGDFYKSGVGITTYNNYKNINNHNGGGSKLKALDFGCGIGRQTLLMREFNIDSYGIDISKYAIDNAKKLSKKFGIDIDFRVFNGNKIPFDDNFFDFTVSYGVLDSMPFKLAKILIKEIERVSKKYFFVTLIGEDSVSDFKNITHNTFSGEIEVQEEHENGTIQSFFNKDKIQELIKNTNLKIKWGEKIKNISMTSNSCHSRYYIVLEKDNNVYN